MPPMATAAMPSRASDAPPQIRLRGPKLDVMMMANATRIDTQIRICLAGSTALMSVYPAPYRPVPEL